MTPANTDPLHTALQDVARIGDTKLSLVDALRDENAQLKRDYLDLRRIADNGQELLDEADVMMADYRRQIDNLTLLADSAIALVKALWQPIETAPEDEDVLLATTGEWVGQAGMLRDEEGQQGWEWKGCGPLHPNHKPLKWQPLPAHPGDLS